MKKNEFAHFEKIIEGMHQIMQLKKSFEESHCCDEEEEVDDEDDDEEESNKEQLEKFHAEYESLFKWSFGKPALMMRKETLKERWAVRHPNLPALFMPSRINNDMANLILLMQIIPHWVEFKKKNCKEGRSCDSAS